MCSVLPEDAGAVGQPRRRRLSKRQRRRLRKQQRVQHRAEENRTRRSQVIYGTTIPIKEFDAKGRTMALRMAKRFWPDGVTPDPVVNDPAYWMLRRVGYDALNPTVMRIGNTPCGPRESETWRWWRTVHYKTQRTLAHRLDYPIVISREAAMIYSAWRGH